MTPRADFATLSGRLAEERTLESAPAVIDLAQVLPPNPPESIQTQFVGLSYLAAYSEAASFVKVADEWSGQHRGRPLSVAPAVLDFGAGWGRISRMLLNLLPATAIYALDVDPLMTALVNTTMPGLNAMTVNPSPPTVLADASMDVAVAFSVFSHLAPSVHDQWASEFARVVKPGGMAIFTALDIGFLNVVAGAKAQVEAGDDSAFNVDMASLFDDIDATRKAFARGVPAYSGNGGGGVRTGDFYGWAAIPRSHIAKVWGAAGFDVVEWVPSGVHFPQAMVGLVRRGRPTPVSAVRRLRSAADPLIVRAKQNPRVRRALRRPKLP